MNKLILVTLLVVSQGANALHIFGEHVRGKYDNAGHGHTYKHIVTPINHSVHHYKKMAYNSGNWVDNQPQTKGHHYKFDHRFNVHGHGHSFGDHTKSKSNQ